MYYSLIDSRLCSGRAGSVPSTNAASLPFFASRLTLTGGPLNLSVNLRAADCAFHKSIKDWTKGRSGCGLASARPACRDMSWRRPRTTAKEFYS